MATVAGLAGIPGLGLSGAIRAGEIERRRTFDMSRRAGHGRVVEPEAGLAHATGRGHEDIHLVADLGPG